MQNMNVPSRLARIYNAAVTHLRHHLPMVAYALGSADGDAALVQLVHVEAEKRAVDIMRDFMDERALGATVRRAGGVAGRIEDRYTRASSGDGEGLFGGLDGTDLAGAMGLGQANTGESTYVNANILPRGSSPLPGCAISTNDRFPVILSKLSFHPKRHRVEARRRPAGRLRLRDRGGQPGQRRREPRGVGARDAVDRVVRAVRPPRRGGGRQGPEDAEGAEEGGEEEARGGQGKGRGGRHGGRLGEEGLEGGRGNGRRRPGGPDRHTPAAHW